MGKKNKKKSKSKKGKTMKNKIVKNKKKILIGAGVAAVGLAAIGGTLFVGKKIYDKRKGKGASGARALVDDGPESPALAPYHQPNPKTFTNTSSIPDAVILGLSYDEDTQARLNLIASVFDQAGNNLGYVQGGGNLSKLFNGAIIHTGDDMAAELGDDENIVFDLRACPSNVSTILFGSFLITPPQGAPAKAYVHMLPMIRNEQIEQQAAQGATRSIEFDSDDEGQSEFATSSRSIDGPEEEDEEDFVRLFFGDIDAVGAQFCQQKGFVGGKIFREGNGWKFTPYRLVVPVDPQNGLWPALEHYAKC